MPPQLDQLARDRIRTWVASTGVTQQQLAERIGRNQAWMSRYLKGQFDADLGTLQKMAEAFGFTITALLDQPRDPQEARLMDEFRALTPGARANLLDFLKHHRLARSRKGRG